MKREVMYSGIVISFEYDDRGELLLYMYGEVEGEERYFYVKPGSEEAENFLKLGVGQSIKGKGTVISKDPLIVSSY
ncbi:MAG: hypothetical protein QXJ84_04565 [Desulfurococcaceae archaeon]